MPTPNTLYFGDNLDILREYIPDESVDLIYLDPPFNSNRSYNVLFREASGRAAESQIQAFDDTWHWTGAAATYDALRTGQYAPAVVKTTEALVEILGHNDVSAYLVMMTARLVELHRVLKHTGSIYLHCDPTASHYLKVVMDTVFGKEQFRNEIIWRRARAHNDRKLVRYGAIHDVILYYSKGSTWNWNREYFEVDHRAPKSHDLYRHSDGKWYRKGDCRAPGGRGPRYVWNGHEGNWRFTEAEARRLEAEGRIVFTRSGMPRVLREVDASRGSPVQDLWIDIDAPNSGSRESLGYPTQKPLALLERIIKVSSNPGEVVMDPFCGCGTAVVAAQKLGRRWIGIDVTYLAVRLIEERLNGMFPAGLEYEVIGVPQDVASARNLAERDRYQFQYWALGLVPAQPVQDKKGADKGIDGLLFFVDEASKPSKKVVLQVKSGHVQSSYVRDLRAVVERENAVMGFLITLEPPTQPMLTEAATAGYYHSPGWNKPYPRLQIRTIGELLDGQPFDYPPANVTLTQAERVRKDAGQGTLL